MIEMEDFVYFSNTQMSDNGLPPEEPETGHQWEQINAIKFYLHLLAHHRLEGPEGLSVTLFLSQEEASFALWWIKSTETGT